MQETVWLGNLPIATVRHGEVHYVHTDHLGTPRAVSEPGNGEVVWEWESDPFGRAEANEDPDGNGKEFTYNLRFPGQYYDYETGKHYNYFRDYEPGAGRYIQADPIGLDGGLNNFKYARQNPAGFADPYGQNPLCIPLVAGDGPLPVGDVACGVLIIGSIYAGANAVKDTSEALDGNSCEPDEADCEEEWEDAFEICQEQIERGEARGVTGGYDNLYQCAKGLVSERCGGNRVE